MGDTFANVQVSSSARSAPSGRGELADRLRAYFAALGYGEASGGSGDRELVIADNAAGSWISIHDSAIESGDDRTLDEIGAVVSSGGLGPAVGVIMHDSDLLVLRLYRNGEVAANFSNWPRYFSGGRKPIHPKLDNADEWLALTPQFRKPSDLRAAWRTSELESAEILLARIAATLGWEDDIVSSGLRGISPARREAGLRLSLSAPSIQRPGISEAALPVFDHVGGSPPSVQVRVGDPVALTIVAHNVGGSSVGLDFVLWGPAFDRGLLDATEVRLVLGPPGGADRYTNTLEIAPSDAGSIRVGRFPGARLQPGPASPQAAFRPGVDHRTGLKDWLAGRVEASVSANALSPGRADVHLGFVPSADPSGGQASWTVVVEIRA